MRFSAALRYKPVEIGFERWWECECGWCSEWEWLHDLPTKMWDVTPPESVHEHLRSHRES